MTLHIHRIHTPLTDRLGHWMERTGAWVLLALFVGLAAGSGWDNANALAGQEQVLHQACTRAVVHTRAVDKKVMLEHLRHR